MVEGRPHGQGVPGRRVLLVATPVVITGLARHSARSVQRERRDRSPELSIAAPSLSAGANSVAGRRVDPPELSRLPNKLAVATGQAAPQLE